MWSLSVKVKVSTFAFVKHAKQINNPGFELSKWNGLRSSQMWRRSKQYYTFFLASRHCLHFNRFNFCLFSLPSCLSPSSPSAPASVSSCVLVGSVRGCPVSLVVSMLSLSCGSMVFVSRGIALFACQDCRYLKLGLEEISVMLMGRQIARAAQPLC